MFPNLEAAAHYLAALIDGEGCVRFGQTTLSRHRYVVITNTERALIDAAEAALEALGIGYTTRFREDRAERENVLGNRPLWDVTVSRRDELERLHELVPLRHPEKAAKLKAIVESYMPRRDIAKIRALYLDGLSMRQIAEQVGWPASTVQYHVSQMGIARRVGRR